MLTPLMHRQERASTASPHQLFLGTSQPIYCLDFPPTRTISLYLFNSSPLNPLLASLRVLPQHNSASFCIPPPSAMLSCCRPCFMSGVAQFSAAGTGAG